MPRMSRQSPRTRAIAQQARRDVQRARRDVQSSSISILDRAFTFESDMKSLDFFECQRCRVRSITLQPDLTLCDLCRRSNRNLFSRENGMDVGEVPNELDGLTMLEQNLIARVHPVVSVFKIRGQQTAYSGHVLNFVQHVEQVALRLPFHPRFLSSMLILSRGTPDGIIQFRVRARRVREALVWLKRNNQYYRDIIIDDEVLSCLPDDGDMASSIATLEATEQPGNESNLDNTLDVSLYPILSNLDASQVISNNLQRLNRASSQGSSIDLGDWPELSEDPLNEFTTEGLICKAFPALFPFGRGDLNEPRLQKIPKHKYFKYLMQYRDGRFARDMRFPYYAYNSLARWDALNCGNVYIRRHSMEGVSAADIAELVDNPDRDLAASIMYYGATLRGTRSFWKQRCCELIQMVRQLGSPTIFFTLSAADYHWPDLFRILSPDIRIDDCDEKTRIDLMHKNPTTVAWFFNKRCELFMKQFMVKVFSVRDFWYRFEWQFRGSPHIHGLLWLDNAPDCSNIDSLDEIGKESIVKYFDKLVSAQLNQRYTIHPRTNPCRSRFSDIPVDDRSRDLDRVLSAIQRHSRCGSHCLRRQRGQRGRRMVCRYKFPMQVEAQSTLRSEEGSWKFFPKRNDPLLQRYNKFVTQVWRGNTDFSAITSKDAVINYISKYASKGEHESPAYSDILNAVINRNPADAPAPTLIRQLLISSVAERNYSAQEVTHLLMGWPLFHASRTMLVLSLLEDWRRVDSETTLVEQYSSRNGLEDISLFEYAKNYRVSGGRTIKRRQECIVRVIPFLKLSDDSVSNENYYKMQCKLHVPWRGNFSDMKPDEVTWEELYLDHIDLADEADSFGDEFPILPDEAEFEEVPDEIFNVVRDSDLVASRLQPVVRHNDPLGRRPIDEAYPWHNLSDLNISSEQVNIFNRELDSARVVESARAPTIELSLLSEKQRSVVQLCSWQINDPNCREKLCIVQGKAGTGKSAVIQTICKMLDESDPSKPGESYQVLAPTGAAAFNVNGKTIHSSLRIPVNAQLQPLNGENLRSFQLEFKDVKFIIIDEYSMVGFRLLYKIHMRLCEARGSSQEIFGGFFVYLFGDLRQLPPVKDTPIYSEPKDDISRVAKSLVFSFQKRVILTVNHRQAINQAQFRDTLDRIAIGKPNQDGWQFLMTRRSSLTPSNMRTFKDAIHLL